MTPRDRQPAARPRGSYADFYRVVAQIPVGRVATYGQVATLADRPGAARQVGYALAALPAGSDVPWHRVVNARGEISARAGTTPFARIQRDLLLSEGVVFDANHRIDLETYRWESSVENSK